VVIDDSIVRGTTLENSIIALLDKLYPKKIVIVSSAPQIRYPDCYGIDMSRMGDFIAFRAMLNLLKKDGKQRLIEETYQKCKEELKKPFQETTTNHVQALYNLYSYGAISAEIARMVRPKHIQAEIEIVFQTVENLHKACPNHLGDWYFTGNYPTPGGIRVANQAFVNFVEGKKGRAY
ncbi:MAG: amidophosphoribosyltransferase, partial [Flammeovirgaceae bacterium]|nr:amidophosphoribosyltransferase [Flammeovirgaceae bacterium]MDW8287358.1 amidophosphoribosyltransferase [Flammeovirgaceae bacterium]